MNAAEDAEHGEDDDGSGGLPAVRAQREQEKGEALEPTQHKSLADPEANRMRVGNDGALTYASTAQVATSEDGLIVAAACNLRRLLALGVVPA